MKESKHLESINFEQKESELCPVGACFLAHPVDLQLVVPYIYVRFGHLLKSYWCFVSDLLISTPKYLVYSLFFNFNCDIQFKICDFSVSPNSPQTKALFCLPFGLFSTGI